MAFFLLSNALHPVHVSVCDVEYDKNEKALKMTMRIFTDDLEMEIRNETGEDRMDILNPPEKYSTDKLFKEYLLKHLKIMVNGQSVQYDYLGHEVEAGSVYCYMIIRNTNQLNSIKVYNNILMNTFDNQVNLVHMEVDKEIHTMLFKGDIKEQKLEY